jgi:hypothetical protein
MPVDRLAAYLGPVIWFSPDEPSLRRTSGLDIREPEAFPFEPRADRPVLYYQLDRVLSRPGATGPAIHRNPAGLSHSVLDLRNVAVFEISYFAYFPTEEGLGAHPHDIEPAEFRVAVRPDNWPEFEHWIPEGPHCAQRTWVIVVTRVTGKAHGLVWFWNVLKVDDWTRFPVDLLVEEGKHALAPDKNGDGVFTRGYDANVRINDAWGTRDIIQTGMLFSGGFESWMEKVRRPEHRVLPPLPDDSPLRRELALRRAPNVENIVYELRPYPPAGSAGTDRALAKLLDEKSIANWPEESGVHDVSEWASALEEGAVLKSLSIAVMADGDVGLSWVFPFFVVKHLEDPLSGGYIVQRMYATASGRREFGWMALYTPSASRWHDTYLAAGAEYAHSRNAAGNDVANWDFVFETGLKFRVNITQSPLKFLSLFTDFWGMRAGIRNRGFFEIQHLTYVLEFGAGSF